MSNDRLVWTWSWDQEDLPPRLVEMKLQPVAGGTDLSIVYEAGSVEERDSYVEGWTHFLGVLTDLSKSDERRPEAANLIRVISSRYYRRPCSSL